MVLTRNTIPKPNLCEQNAAMGNVNPLLAVYTQSSTVREVETSKFGSRLTKKALKTMMMDMKMTMDILSEILK
uniref:Uncharacterized protein n=1 Tax=Cannabis sativa TaxID=3483 RepID=A0A803NNC2_CANSA